MIDFRCICVSRKALAVISVITVLNITVISLCGQVAFKPLMVIINGASCVTALCLCFGAEVGGLSVIFKSCQRLFSPVGFMLNFKPQAV